MKHPVIIATVTMLALGVIAAQNMRSADATVESLALAQTISPFEMMQRARGLPIQVTENAF